jgi:NAD(P)-dependent dehydrogenase (short-subunit alcohol dehydrogenase family)
VRWDGNGGIAGFQAQLDSALERYRRDYEKYYSSFEGPDSPTIRDANPTVVLVPGVGMFSFGKNKTEARITGEFYTNAVHVMEGATALGASDAKGAAKPTVLPQAGPAAKAEAFEVYSNYVALPASEAFRIEYWALEEAKIRRQPPEKELSRRVCLVVGGANGIGRETVLLAIQRGAHVVVADKDLESAKVVADEARKIGDKEAATAVEIDIRDRDSIRKALREAIAVFGGLDIIVNTAAIFPSSPDGKITDAQWGVTLDINVTANHRLMQEAAAILNAQDLKASVVLVSSANAIVPKHGSEAYDVSKAAVNHLVREFAISLAPKIRVNGISPATVVKGSTMFPRDRVIASLKKYNIAFDEKASDDALRAALAEFYAQRTLTHQPIEPADCAAAILFLAGPQSRCTSGHLIPVDGGLTEAFLR